jgi:hypothetical protein
MRTFVALLALRAGITMELGAMEMAPVQQRTG